MLLFDRWRRCKMRQMDVGWEFWLRFLLLNILRNIYDDTTRYSALGDGKSLLDDPWNVMNAGDQVAMLHDGHRHTDKIRFLKSTLANHRLWDLSSYGNQRNGVHEIVGNAG